MSTRILSRKLFGRAYLIAFAFLAISVSALARSGVGISSVLNGVVCLVWLASAIAEHIKYIQGKKGATVKYTCDPRTTEDIVKRMQILLKIVEVEIVSWSKPKDNIILMIRVPHWLDQSATLALGSTIGIIEMGEWVNTHMTVEEVAETLKKEVDGK